MSKEPHHTQFEDSIDEIEVIPLALPMDRDTVAWLLQLSNGDDAVAAELIASMIRSIREDDEAFNQTLH
jgi:hypothetical protein